MDCTHEVGPAEHAGAKSREGSGQHGEILNAQAAKEDSTFFPSSLLPRSRWGENGILPCQKGCLEVRLILGMYRYGGSHGSLCFLSSSWLFRRISWVEDLGICLD